MTQSKIVCHHVGGRGFGVSFNAPSQFWDDIIHVLYEADRKNVDEMQADPNHPQRALLGKEFYITPYCLGECHMRAKLRVTANPFASSLLEPSPRFFQYYCEVPIPPTVRDFTYHDMLNVVQETEVEVYALDELLSSERIPYKSPPDFLSIDTQGYELPIMRGAHHAISKHVLGIVVEVEIKEMYRNQPLFGDVLAFLSDAGFHFAGFPYLQEISTFRAPVGFRGKGFPGFGDALFLRRIDEIAKMTPSAAEQRLLLRKLSFIALNFAFTEYALDALLAAERLGSGTGSNERSYDRFLDQMLAAYRDAEPLYPRFVGVPSRSPQASPASGNAAERPAESGNEKACARKPGLVRRLVAHVEKRAQRDPRRIRHLALAAPATAASKLLFHYATAMGFGGAAVSTVADLPANVNVTETAITEPAAAAPEIAHETPFERLLNEWGFAGVAGIVRMRRLASEAAVRAEGPAVTDGPDFGPAAVARMYSG